MYLQSAADGILKTHYDFRQSVPEGRDPDAFLAELNEIFMKHDAEVQDKARALKKRQ